jgi:hypothetical protein
MTDAAVIDKDCCPLWRELIQEFRWFNYADNHDLLCMPSLGVSKGIPLWRVDYCPSCGAYVRDCVVSRHRVGVAIVDDVDKMVDRFLVWPLPDDFSPDGGITFTPFDATGYRFRPIGTNLLTAEQARKMFEYVLCADAQQPPPK